MKIDPTDVAKYLLEKLGEHPYIRQTSEVMAMPTDTCGVKDCGSHEVAAVHLKRNLCHGCRRPDEHHDFQSVGSRFVIEAHDRSLFEVIVKETK